MFLTGEEIWNNKMIKDEIDKNIQIQPCSFDLTMGNTFICYDDVVLDINNDNIRYVKFESDTVLLAPTNNSLLFKMLKPLYKKYYKYKYKVNSVVFGGLLATTNETVFIPNNCIGLYNGRSSLARLFLDSHVCGGLIDSGFQGKITLELIANSNPIILRKDMRIGQLSVAKLTKETFSYNGKYQGQDGVVESKIYQDVK